MEYVLGIHIVVPARIARRVTSARHRAYFLDPPVQHFPLHVTLYLCSFSRAAYRQLLKDFRYRRFPSVVVHLDRVRILPGNGDRRIVTFQVRRTRTLVRLHAAVMLLGNRRRKNLLRKKDVRRIRTGEFSAYERRLTVRFGYRRAGRGFSPHVTVAPVPVRRATTRQLVGNLRDVAGSSWRAKRLVVGLYRFNNMTGRYVGRVRERRIRLR